MDPHSKPTEPQQKDQELPLVLCLKAIAEVIQRNDPCLAISTPPTQALTNEELSQRVAYALREVCGQSETFGHFSAAELAAANIPPYLEWLRHRLLSGDVAEACLPAGFESERKKSKKKVVIKKVEPKQPEPKQAEAQRAKDNAEAQRARVNAEAKFVAHAAAHVDPMVAALNELELQNKRRQPMPPRHFGPAMAPVLPGMMPPGARVPPLPTMPTMPPAYGLPAPPNMPLPMPMPNYPSVWPPANPPRGNGKARDDSIARQLNHLQAVNDASMRDARPEWTRSQKLRHNPEAGSSSKAGSASKVDREARRPEIQKPDPFEDDIYTDDRNLNRIDDQQQSDTRMADTVMTGTCEMEPQRSRYQAPYVEDEGWSHVDQEHHMESDDAWEWLDMSTEHQYPNEVEIDDCPEPGDTIDDDMLE